MSRIVPTMRDAKGDIYKCTVEARQMLTDYYQELYAAMPVPPRDLYSPLLENFPLPSIPQSLSHDLEQPLTLEELGEALSELNLFKTPGPDGYPIEFLQCYRSILLSHLLAVCAEEAEHSPWSWTLPLSWCCQRLVNLWTNVPPIGLFL